MFLQCYFFVNFDAVIESMRLVWPFSFFSCIGFGYQNKLDVSHLTLIFIWLNWPNGWGVPKFAYFQTQLTTKPLSLQICVSWVTRHSLPTALSSPFCVTSDAHSYWSHDASLSYLSFIQIMFSTAILFPTARFLCSLFLLILLFAINRHAFLTTKLSPHRPLPSSIHIA